LLNCGLVPNMYFFLDSERNNECTDFIMMCVFLFLYYLSLYTISSRNSASIFNFSVFSGGKENLVGALLRRSKFKFKSKFSKVPGTTKFKLSKNENFYA